MLPEIEPAKPISGSAKSPFVRLFFAVTAVAIGSLAGCGGLSSPPVRHNVSLSEPVDPNLFLPNDLHDGWTTHLYRRSQLPLMVYFVRDRYYTPERQRIALQGLTQWVEAVPHPLFTYTVTPRPDQADTIVQFSPNLPDGIWGTTIYDYVVVDQVIGKSYTTLTVDREETPARLQSTAAHEFGHALGMNVHTKDCRDAMKGNFYCGFPETPPPLSERDINTLKTAYSWLFTSSPAAPLN